jgi:hypothetical protein
MVDIKVVYTTARNYIQSRSDENCLNELKLDYSCVKNVPDNTIAARYQASGLNYMRVYSFEKCCSRELRRT